MNKNRTELNRLITNPNLNVEQMYQGFEANFKDILNQFEKFNEALFKEHRADYLSHKFVKQFGVDFKNWDIMKLFIQIRNIFTHNGGIIDKDFVDKCNPLGLEIDFSKLLNKKYPLNKRVFEELFVLMKSYINFIKMMLNEKNIQNKEKSA
jgi:hypothetical protein